MKLYLHWQRDNHGWQTRMVWLDGSEGAGRGSIEQNNELNTALKNPLKFRMNHLKDLEGDSKNMSPEQKRDFRDMAGYFLSLKQKSGTENLPPQMLVQIEKSPLFSLLSKKMQDQIKNALDSQLEELIDFEKKTIIDTPAKAMRASILYRRLRSRAHDDKRLKPVFNAVQKNLIGWAIERLRKGSIASQVKDTLMGVRADQKDAEPLKKEEKLLIAGVYKMFPQSEDWVDHCDSQTARAFAQEAVMAIKENPEDPTLVIGWGMIDEWIAEGDTDLLASVTEKFTPEQLTQYIGKARAVELLFFAKKESPFLPAHLRALNSLKEESVYMPHKLGDYDWQKLTSESEEINKINNEKKVLKEEYEEAKQKEIDLYEETHPNAEEVLKYKEALQKEKEATDSCWTDHVSQTGELIREWDNVVKFEVQAAEARQKVLDGRLHLTDDAQDTERKEKYKENQDKYIAKYKQRLEETLPLFKAIQDKFDQETELSQQDKAKTIAEFQKLLLEKFPHSGEYAVSSEPKEDAFLLNDVKAGLDKHEQDVKTQQDMAEAEIKKMPFSESFDAKQNKYDEDIKVLEENEKELSEELMKRDEWHEVYSNPREHAEKATEKFWKGLQGRLDRRQLHAADFDILWNDEFAEELEEKIQNRPELETIQRFRTAFEKALEGIFEGLELTDDKYETWYEALDEKLSYENLISLLKKNDFDIREEFVKPQQLSELLEGAITNYRDTIFAMVKDRVEEDQQDEFYSNWGRLHGRLSAPIPDPTVVALEHSRYEAEKMETEKKIQEEQERNLSIIEALRKRGEEDPEMADHYNVEADKLAAAWEVRKNWYGSGGRMTIETADGSTTNIWAPGKNILAEMTLQAKGVEKEIRSTIENGIKSPIFAIQEKYKEIQKSDSEAEKKRKLQSVRTELEDFFKQWPGQKTRLKKLIGDHHTVLEELIPKEEDLGMDFVREITEESTKWLDKLDERMLAWKSDAKSCGYKYHGDEELFQTLPNTTQELVSVIDFSEGQYAKESEKLDGYLEEDTETVEFLDKEQFFSDPSADRKEFKGKYEEMRESYRSNVSQYKKQFGSVRSKIQQDLNNMNDDDFTNRYNGIPRENMEQMILDHEHQLKTFDEGSGKFLSPSFFNNWLRKYGESAESRVNALDEMSQFRGLESWSTEARNQADSMGKWIEDWDKNKLKNVKQYQRFSLYDIYALVKQAVEVNRRRWERNSERAVANIGENFFGRKSPWGKEFHRKSQETEEARVKEIQTELNEDPWWEIQDILYKTNDPDEAKACINELIDKGVFKWDDPKLWKTFMRLSGNAINFTASDMNQTLAQILDKCRDVCEFIWSRETFRQWDTTLESKIKSKEDEFSADFQRFEDDKEARVVILQNMLKNWANGKRENTDPAKYGLFLRKAFELGKLNGGPLSDSRWFYLTQGVKYGILSRDFFGRLNGELLGNMPYFDFFIDKSGTKKDGKLVPEGTPGSHGGGWTYEDYVSWADFLAEGTSGNFTVDDARKNTKEFFYEIVLQSGEAQARVERKVREGAKNFDHDDGPLFSAALGIESVKKMLNTTSTDEDKYTPDFWRSILAGYMPYFNGISKFIREGDEKYGLEDAGWKKMRERNFGEVADRMKAMILVEHSLLGNINFGERKSILFTDHDFKLKGPMSPCAEGSMNSTNKIFRKMLDISGNSEQYESIFDKNTWLSTQGKIATAKESETADEFYGEGKHKKPQKDTITGKLFDLLKGPASKEVFTDQNVEKMLLDKNTDWDNMMTTFKAAVY